MRIAFGRRKRLGKRITTSLSKRGISLTRRPGHLSVKSRGKGSSRLGKGFSILF